MWEIYRERERDGEREKEINRQRERNRYMEGWGVSACQAKHGIMPPKINWANKFSLHPSAVIKLFILSNLLYVTMCVCVCVYDIVGEIKYSARSFARPISVSRGARILKAQLFYNMSLLVHQSIYKG